MKWIKKLFSKKKEKAVNNKLIGLVPGILHSIKIAGSLHEVFEIHKYMWEKGFRGRSIEPDYFGVFRTNSIPEMIPEEVFLGNIYGIWTFNIPTWEKHKVDHKEEYQLVLNQYKMLLNNALVNTK